MSSETPAGGAVHDETEWQFDAPDLAVVRRLLESGRELGGFQLRACAARDLTDCYLDTADARVASAGYALRLRSDGARSEATLKSLRSAGTGPKIRKEISQPIELCSVEALLAASGPVSDRTRAVVGAQPLEAWLKVRTHREVFEVMAGDAVAAEIDLDDTRFGEPGDAGAPLQRVEVELGDATVASLQPLLVALREAASLEPARRSKLEVGLEACGGSTRLVRAAAPLPIDAAMPAVAVGQGLLQRQLAAWRGIEPAVRLGDDPEALHELRVAGRRMVAALRILEAASLGGAIGLRRRVQAMLGRMSPLRDIDVLHAELSSVNRSLPGAGLLPALRALESLRHARQRQLLRLLDSSRVRHLLAALDALSVRAPARTRQAAIGVAAPDLLRRRYRRMRSQARLATAEGSADACHRLRLEAKKLRYVAEPLAVLYGRPMLRFLRRLQTLQTLLGRMNDARHVIAGMERLVASRRRLPATTVLAMGRVIEVQQRRIDDSLEALENAWRRVRGRAWRQLRRTMQASSPLLRPPPEPARRR